MGIVRRVIAAAALAGIMAIGPLGALAAEPQASPAKSTQVVVNGGQGDWPLAR